MSCNKETECNTSKCACTNNVNYLIIIVLYILLAIILGACIF